MSTHKSAKKKYILDEEEQTILTGLEGGKLKPSLDSKPELKKLKKAATAYLNKVHRVNIRLMDSDYTKAQEEALMEGIPPATLLSSILHKFFTGQLVESRAV
jgi:predicted DNA binding CopG/RHH family protein